ncbi:MAG TPA: aldehyde dehydrogenase family protein, partial [Hydrogenophaga sp.]
MQELFKFYINGTWVPPQETLRPHDVIDPSTETVAARIALGSAADVDVAVKAAQTAFATYSQTTVQERVALLERVIEQYMKRFADIASAISVEMGAPAGLAKTAQAGIGLAHVKTALAVLKNYAFEEPRGTTLLRKEPIGVCGFITPWNWPTNQVMCKVAPALATGCTMVLKPSEMAPLSAQILAEVMDAAGVPAGVFNMINGDGPGVGSAIAAHPGIDLVSFTGSTRAGIAVAQA